MGRWVIEDAGSHEKIVVLDDKLFAGGPERYMMDAHNADCDAYEKRIAELEAEQGRLRQIILDDGMELARVKAESLRVVVDGEAVELDKIQRHQYVQWEGHVCVPDKLRCDIVRITDNHRYDVRQQYCDSFRFPPVRLERWETEE